MRNLIVCGLVMLTTSCSMGGCAPYPMPEDERYTPPPPGKSWQLASEYPGDLPASWYLTMVRVSDSAWVVRLPPAILEHISDPQVSVEGLDMRQGGDGYYSTDTFGGSSGTYRYLSVQVYADRTDVIVRYPDGSGGAVEILYSDVG